MTATSDPTPRALKAAAIALVALVAFSYGFVPIRASNDVWWHLKSGEVILKRGGLPENDVFTYTGENIPWHNHEWLAQVLFYKVFDWGGGRTGNLIGLRALIGFKALLLAATFLFVLVIVQQRIHCMTVAVLVTLLAIDVSRFTFYPRPPILTYFFLAVFLLVLNNWKSGRWPKITLAALPPIMVLWANMHGGFLVGLLLVLFFFLGEIAEHFVWPRGEEEAVARSSSLRQRLAWLGGILTACGLGSLCTPYGIHLYELPFRVMGSADLVKTIAEMRSPLAPDLARHFVSFFVMGGLIVGALAAVHFLARARPPVADLLLLLFFGYEAIRHQRHLPLFAITTAPLLAWAFGRILARESERLRRRTSWLAAALALLVTVHWLGLRDFPESYLNRNRRLARGITYLENNFPKTVCDFIVYNRFDGRMFNPINSAGYLIWRLSPERHKLFTDSRFDVFGDRFVWYEYVVRDGIESRDWAEWEKKGALSEKGRHLREHVHSMGWPEILDKWNVNFIVAERSWKVVPRLIASRYWTQVFSWTKPFEPETGYEIFIRNTAANGELISRCLESYERFQEQHAIYVR